MKQCKIVIYSEASHVKSSNNKVNNCYLPQVLRERERERERERKKEGGRGVK